MGGTKDCPFICSQHGQTKTFKIDGIYKCIDYPDKRIRCNCTFKADHHELVSFFAGNVWPRVLGVVFDYTLKMLKASINKEYQTVKILTNQVVFAQSDSWRYEIVGDCGPRYFQATPPLFLCALLSARKRQLIIMTCCALLFYIQLISSFL
jgi:hypothetical protein